MLHLHSPCTITKQVYLSRQDFNSIQLNKYGCIPVPGRETGEQIQIGIIWLEEKRGRFPAIEISYCLPIRTHAS
jgi:hypothetical protein